MKDGTGVQGKSKTLAQLLDALIKADKKTVLTFDQFVTKVNAKDVSWYKSDVNDGITVGSSGSSTFWVGNILEYN